MKSTKWIGIAAVAAISASIGGIGLVQAATNSGNSMTAIAPCRLVDTRGPIGPRATPLGANETVTFTATGNNGQCTGIAADAQAIEVQITSTEATTAGYVTAFPADLTTPPNVSHLNTRPGAVISNSTIVSLSPTGQFKLYNFSGSTNLIVDVLAVFSPSGAGSGAAGPKGDTGATGAKGDAGESATYVGEEWGAILRNTIGGGNASLRGGPVVQPFGGTAISAPPYGVGSLELLVDDGTSKVAFGNEVDFRGDAVADLDAIGFSLFTTGENGATNMPNITFELDPDGPGPLTYTSLIWNPAPLTIANQWSGYIDATVAANGSWYTTGTTATTCTQSTPACDWDTIKAQLPAATIWTVAVAKGRDNAFQGAVDGLRINDTIFDFEPLGVNAIPVAP